MQKNFENLYNEFLKIKNMGLIKTLRNGTTGAGYTFETLLGKEEDQESKPDFEGIEIKTQYGYSKQPISLFNCVPKRNKQSAVKYLFERYNYSKISNPDISMLCLRLKANQFETKHEYSFKLKIDYLGKFIVLQSYYNDEFFEDICYWDFKDLQLKLENKLKQLAIIETYPYRKSDGDYYKYVKMKCYKLKGFFEFLRLIEDGKIFIIIYITKNKNNDNGFFNYHSVTFKLENSALTKLFYEVYK